MVAGGLLAVVAVGGLQEGPESSSPALEGVQQGVEGSRWGACMMLKGDLPIRPGHFSTYSTAAAHRMSCRTVMHIGGHVQYIFGMQCAAEPDAGVHLRLNWTSAGHCSSCPHSMPLLAGKSAGFISSLRCVTHRAWLWACSRQHEQRSGSLSCSTFSKVIGVEL